MSRFKSFARVVCYGTVAAAGSLGLLSVVQNHANRRIILAKAEDPNTFPEFTTKVWDNNWDRRESNEKPKKIKKQKESVPYPNPWSTEEQVEEKEIKPTATRHLILLRHGHYFMEGMDGGKEMHGRLTETGREQADCTGERLKALKINCDKIVTSTMPRAKETTEEVKKYFPEVPIEECSMLCEGAPIPPEPPSKNWKPERVQFFQDSSRIEAAFRKYFHRASPEQTKDSIEMLICHGNVIRYFVCRVLQFPPEGWLRMSIGHCGITWVTIRPNGKVSLKMLGNTGHLPPHLLSY